MLQLLQLITNGSTVLVIMQTCSIDRVKKLELEWHVFREAPMNITGCFVPQNRIMNDEIINYEEVSSQALKQLNNYSIDN